MHLLFLVACQQDASWARAKQIETLDEGVGGPKAMARPGDYLLENDRVRAAILGPRTSLGPSPFGGTLADLDLNRDDPKYGGGHGNDELAEVFGTVNMNLIQADQPESVTIGNSGEDGEAAFIHVEGDGAPFLSMLKALWALVDQPDFKISTDYILEPGSPAIKLVTTASLDGAPASVTDLAGETQDLPILPLAMTDGIAFGDFYLQGGSIDVFAPGIGFDEDRAVYEADSRGQNTFQNPFKFEYVAGVGDGVSYAIAAASGDVFIPLFTSSQTAVFGAGIEGVDNGAGKIDRFPGGAAYSYTRYVGVGRGDVGSALDALMEARGDAFGTVRGNVIEEGTGVSVPHVSVLVYKVGKDKPWMQWESDVGDDTQMDGSFGGKLPPGEWELVVHGEGRPTGERVKINLKEGQTITARMAALRPGQVDVHVVDETGRDLPSKVTFYRVDGAPVLDPAVGDHYITGNPAEVVFLPHGSATVVLPPGKYTAIASRGIEYELGHSDEFTVRDTGIARLEMQVEHSVDTNGWISADFHVHAGNSFDSGVQLEDRVITMVAEGVDFFSSNDHDFLTDYAPAVENLDLEPWVKTAVGLETTTLEIGHYLSFPLAADTLKDQGGAFDWTGMTPDQIVAELDDIGVKAGYQPMKFVAHPRDGILGLFDQFGFNPYDGLVHTPTLGFSNDILKDSSNFTTAFDALELLNGKRFELIRTPTQPELDVFGAGGTMDSYSIVERAGKEQEDMIDGIYHLGYGHEGQVDDWFTLLNTGVRLTALGNSDTHSRFSIEAGCPRNYVQVGEDDPGYLDEQGVADAVKAGKVVASYGPFIDFTLEDHGLGEEVVVDDGVASLHIEVQAPTWMSVDRVELYENGTLIHEWEGLDPDVLKFVQDIDVPVTKDSWFVVIALGDDDLSPVFTPVEYPPVQLQDVVIEALSDIPAIGSFLSPAVPIPRTGKTLPYALTNPIYVDVDGAGWVAPGIPAWMVQPVKPE